MLQDVTMCCNCVKLLSAVLRSSNPVFLLCLLNLCPGSTGHFQWRLGQVCGVKFCLIELVHRFYDPTECEMRT